MGRLEIRVCGARNLGNTQRIGIPDPYVKVKIGEKKSKTRLKYKTRIIDNNLNPVWNELFKFQIADYDSTCVLFEVWNEKIGVDELMGSYTLTINGLERGVVKDIWVLLSDTKKSTAELHLRILAVDFGLTPQNQSPTLTSLEQDNLTVPTNQYYKPARTDAQLAAIQSIPGAPQGLPPPVVYGGLSSQNNNNMPPPPVLQQQQPPVGYTTRPPMQPVPYGMPQTMPPHNYGLPPPPQQYYPPPAPQPMYAPQPPMPMYARAPQPMYAPLPEPMRPPYQQPMQPPRPLQYACGVPPDI